MHADDGWWRRGVCGALSVEAILWSGDGSVAGSAGIGVLDGGTSGRGVDPPRPRRARRVSSCSGPGRPQRHMADPGSCWHQVEAPGPPRWPRRPGSRQPAMPRQLVAARSRRPTGGFRSESAIVLISLVVHDQIHDRNGHHNTRAPHACHAIDRARGRIRAWLRPNAGVRTDRERGASDGESRPAHADPRQRHRRVRGAQSCRRRHPPTSAAGTEEA